MASKAFDTAGKSPKQLGQELVAELAKGYWGANEERANALIDAGASLEERDDKGNTPLLLASLEGLTKLGIKLVESNADVNAANKRGDTALHITLTPPGWGMERGHDEFLEIASAVLKKKPNVNVVNDLNQTPLRIAAGEGLFYFVKDILELNPKLRVKDSFNHQTALQAAKANPYGAATVKILQQAYAKRAVGL